MPTGGPLKLGAGILVHGSRGGTVGAGPEGLVTSGTIRAETAGQQIIVTWSTVTKQGTLGALGGSLSVSNLGATTGTIAAGVRGLVTIPGAFTNDAVGTIRAAIGGTATSQFGRVSVSGAATRVRLTALSNVNTFSGVTPLALQAGADPESDSSGSLAGALAGSTATPTRRPVTWSNLAKPLGGASLRPVPVTALHSDAKMAHANLTTRPAGQSQPAWLRRFLLDLAQDDPDRDLRVVLPTTVDHAPAHAAGAQHPLAPALLRRWRA